MKKIRELFLLLIVTFSLMGIDIYVDGNNTQGPWNGSLQHPWRYIQQAVDVANWYDEIIAFEFTYIENVDLDNTNFGILTIRSIEPDDPNVVANTIIQPANSNEPTFIRGSTDLYANISFTGLTIKDGSYGIRVLDNFLYSTILTIQNCTFDHNNFAIMSDSVDPIYVYNSTFSNNISCSIRFTHNWVENRESLIVSHSLFYNNWICLESDLNMSVTDCTITNNNCGIFSVYADCVISNSIIYGNEEQFIISYGDYYVTYSNIEGGYPGTGNIDSDPLFEDAANNVYSLKWTSTEKSPCINSGDPNSPLDPDGTRTDMGALYHHSDLKTYEFCGPYTLPHCGWTWLCFDILDIYNPDITNQVQYLLDPIKLNLHHGEHEGNNFLYNGSSWSGGTELITSPKGYKIRMTDDDSFEVAGFRCPPDTEFPIYEGEDNWIGYFLKETQQVYDAFGSQHLENIYSIQHQDWSIDNSRGWPDVNYTLSPGDMVIVKCYEDIESFVWQDPSRSRTEPFIVLFPELYTYTEEADYLPIYVELDENDLPDEIAVFVDNECKGARVVQHTLENICAYITELQSGSVEIEFAYYGRNARRRFTEYTVFNKITGSPETTAINLNNKQDHYYVSFRSGDDTSSDLPVKITASNYPNPFNPSTVISYDLPQESKVSISIYNLKGQKVKELIEGSQSAGSFSVEWNGEDEHGKPVSSGIYYYRLTACGKTINRKMLLLK